MEKEITWAYIMGLVQGDGTFYIVPRADGHVEFRIILTMSQKNTELLEKVKAFYDLKNVTYSVHVTGGSEGHPSVNIVVSSSDSILEFMDGVDSCDQIAVLFPDKNKEIPGEFKYVPGICFLGDKYVEYRCFTAAFLSYREDEISKPTIYAAKDIIEQLRIERGTAFAGPVTPLSATKSRLVDPLIENFFQQVEEVRAQLLDRRFNFVHDVPQIAFNVAEKIKKYGDLFLNHLSPKESALADFIAGYVEADGSFQITFQVNLDKNEQPVLVKAGDPSKGIRQEIEVKPLFSLTEARGSKQKLRENEALNVVRAMFGGAYFKGVYEAPGKGSERLVIKYQAQLREFVIPFFSAVQPLTSRNKKRFEALKQTVSLLPVKDMKAAKTIIDLAYDPETSRGKRPRTKENLESLFQQMLLRKQQRS